MKKSIYFDILKKTVCIYLIAVMSGIFLVYLYMDFLPQDSIIMNSDVVFPDSGVQIFAHNLKIFCLMYIPFLGFLSFMNSIIVIHAYIAHSILYFGIEHTIAYLLHYPVEIFALCIPLSISNFLLKKIQKEYIRPIIFMSGIGVLLLGLSAWIEISLR